MFLQEHLESWKEEAVERTVTFRQWFTADRRRRLWQLLTVLSLIVLAIGMVITWRELPEGEWNPRFSSLALAVGVYVTAFVSHLIGWHALAMLMFGRLPFKENARAIALSDLLKYLPTVAWYIANRVHFYERFDTPRRAVVKASFLELLIMIGTGAALYAVVWLSSFTLSALDIIGLVSVLLVLLFVIRARPSQILGERLNGSSPRKVSRGWYWFVAVLFYGIGWFLGGLFLGAIVGTFTSVEMGQFPALLRMWLMASMAGYLVSVTLGAFGIAREATLSFLVAQTWSWPVAIAVAIMVKLLLTLGQIGCDLLVIGLLRVHDEVVT